MIKNKKRKLYAEYLNERIYGSITLLAVNIGLLLHVESLSILNAYYVILSTTLGLWAASLFALLLSYRAVHKQNMPRKDLLHEVIVHRGILTSALPSIIILTLSLVGITSLQNALLIDIILSITSLIFTIYKSSHVDGNNVIEAIMSISIQIVIAAFIIAVKLLE